MVISETLMLVPERTTVEMLETLMDIVDTLTELILLLQLNLHQLHQVVELLALVMTQCKELWLTNQLNTLETTQDQFSNKPWEFMLPELNQPTLQPLPPPPGELAGAVTLIKPLLMSSF